MRAMRWLVVSSLILVVACRTERPTTPETPPVPQAPPATGSTAPPDQLPACYPAVTPGGPSVLPAASVTGNIPLYVPLPTTINSPTQIRPYFDWFSWEEFIALNWPASSVGRGNPLSPGDPSVFKNAPAGTPTVWSTYKANWELFDQGNDRPTPFDSYDVPVAPTCGTGTVGGAGKTKTLVMTSKGNSVLNDGVEAFSFPLVDNTKEYVMYEVRYARQPYEFMRGTDNNPAILPYKPTAEFSPQNDKNDLRPGKVTLRAELEVFLARAITAAG